MRRGSRSLIRILVFVFTIILIFSFIYKRQPKPHPLTIDPIRLIVMSGKPSHMAQKLINKQIQYHSMGCKLPKLRVDEPSLRKLFFQLPPLQCGVEKNWVKVEKGEFVIEKEALSKHGNITCQNTYFQRKSQNNIQYGPIIPKMETGTASENDFFTAQCKAADGETFKNSYATVVPQNKIMERLQDTARASDWSGLNLYLLGFESVSHINAVRKLPKTYAFLRSMEMTMLEGYNSIGDKTVDSLIPILTGKTQEELPLVEKGAKQTNYLDKAYPFIWKDFKEAGYATLFGEDKAKDSIFSQLSGFKEQPTDHYLYPFIKESETKRHTNCQGHEPWHVANMRYVEELFDNYPEKFPKMAILFLRHLSHENINQLELADDDIVSHLKRMTDNGHMEKTAFIFMSDLGFKSREILSTQSGKLERHLPIMGIALPKSFREGRGEDAWENLKKNVRRMTSPFDIHQTITDLLRWPTMPKEGDKSQRAISLWNEVPKDRNCHDASIEPKYCSCLEWEQLGNSHQMTSIISEAVIEAINRETKKLRNNCAIVTLEETHFCKRLVPNRSVRISDEVEFAEYQIKLTTKPGKNTYVAIVNYDKRSGQIVVDLDTVIHVTERDLGRCVTDNFVAKWCICYYNMTK